MLRSFILLLFNSKMYNLEYYFLLSLECGCVLLSCEPLFRVVSVPGYNVDLLVLVL
jgi:hypothetical protein